MNEDEIFERWKEHFEEAFIVDSVGNDMPDGSGAVTVELLPEITKSEILEGEIRGKLKS